MMQYSTVLKFVKWVNLNIEFKWSQLFDFDLEEKKIFSPAAASSHFVGVSNDENCW